jgi:hypothetical protein
VKTSYAEHVGVEKMADLVRKMMKDQHKGMLIALRDGQFDEVIDGSDGAKSAPKVAPAPSSASVASPSAPTAVESVPEVLPAAVAASVAAAVAASVVPPPTASQPVIAEVERAPFEAVPSDLQPPPPNLFRPRTGGNYSTVVATPEPKPAVVVRPSPGARPASTPPGSASRSASQKPSSPPAGKPAQPPAAATGQRQAPIRRTSSPPAPPVAPDTGGRLPRRPTSAPVHVAKAPEARYASARPAAIFGQSKPRGGSSIFGEDIISDKSLDEVIMSYLAEDSKDAPPKSSSGLNEPKRRK